MEIVNALNTEIEKWHRMFERFLGKKKLIDRWMKQG